MEKRFVVFIVLTMLVLTGHVFLQSIFAPPRPAQLGELPPDATAGNEPVDGPPGGTGDPPAETPVDETSTAGTPSRGEDDRVVAEPPDADVSPDELLSAADAEPQRLAFGSYDGAAGPLLAFVNSRGGALERVELVERTENGQLRYRDLEDKSGYLGYLGLTEVPGRGCRVNVVAAATPAALAVPAGENRGDTTGLVVGDVISAGSIGTAEPTVLTTPADLQRLLGATGPGDELRLVVERESGGTKSTIELVAKLAVRPFQVIRPEPAESSDSPPHPLSCLFSLTKVDGKTAPSAGAGGQDLARDGVWDVRLLDSPSPGVEFQLELPTGLELVKRFRLGEQESGGDETTRIPYHLDLELAIRNLADRERQVAYQLDGPNGLPLEGWWYAYKTHPVMFKAAGARDILIRHVGRRPAVGGLFGDSQSGQQDAGESCHRFDWK